MQFLIGLGMDILHVSSTGLIACQVVSHNKTDPLCIMAGPFLFMI